MKANDGGRSLERTHLNQISLITPDLPGKNAKKQGIRAGVLDIPTHFQSFTGAIIYGRIPYAMEQGILDNEQGIRTREQGMHLLVQGIA